MPNPTEISKRNEAAALVSAWKRADAELNALRLRKLASLDEREAAEIFARITRHAMQIPLRPSSGLVEQQAIFQRLREGAK